MTRALISYPEIDRKAVVARRIAKKTGGLGYLAALDYQRAKDIRDAKKKKVVLPIEDTAN
jgi:hypothetical protein